jgi:predicted enzyme related to lactoylglutathione lyase
MSKSIKKSRPEIVIKVNDLEKCRFFYRNVLDLGEPVFDSNFAVSFDVDDRLSLTLEATDAKYLEHASSAVMWRFEVDDIDGMQKKMESAGVSFSKVEGGSAEYYCGSDPEGNRFLVRKTQC